MHVINYIQLSQHLLELLWHLNANYQIHFVHCVSEKKSHMSVLCLFGLIHF